MSKTPKCQTAECRKNATQAISHPQFAHSLLQCDKHAGESLAQFVRHGYAACTVQAIIRL